ncbi:endonuclease domain-containing protein [Microvirga soli]|uniref:endonuclease domain-containing protein n=1 Tax=Microvirga soli TaxID=1854496 RepID=UPI0019200A94|nr:DUF559 domain-containing protein [Microvirga soli]
MRKRKRQRQNPRPSTFSGIVLPGVVGEAGWSTLGYNESTIRRFARTNRRNPTSAERHLHRILNDLNGGVLRGSFKVQHPISGKWIVDFFFPEIRLAIEVDGSVHQLEAQKVRDAEKDRDCERFDITLIRVRNAEIFGEREMLISKLRAAWVKAKRRENRIIGKPYVPQA